VVNVLYAKGKSHNIRPLPCSNESAIKQRAHNHSPSGKLRRSKSPLLAIAMAIGNDTRSKAHVSHH
jgi:hypothetical protein